MTDIVERLRDRSLVIQYPERERIASEIERLRAIIREGGWTDQDIDKWVAARAADQPTAMQPANYELAIEYQMMNPPKPMTIGVFRAGTCNVVAALTIDQVRYIVARWAEMESARATDQQSAVSQKCIYCAMDMEPVQDADGAWWHDKEECRERNTDKT
jgi:hypothetical protein